MHSVLLHVLHELLVQNLSSFVQANTVKIDRVLNAVKSGLSSMLRDEHKVQLETGGFGLC